MQKSVSSRPSIPNFGKSNINSLRQVYCIYSKGRSMQFKVFCAQGFYNQIFK
ncbi:MAG: hypothetical protein K0R59_546 [Sphingobacterium sp.]|jgi:hypothetical protein|nr:hypothetical protein [Sphingobacterium sp.]